jgi:hypothetical protein
MRARVEFQAFGIEKCFQLRLSCFDIEVAAGKQVVQQETLGRSVRVQREIHPLDIHIQASFQSRNARRAQIAPGAHEIGEDLQLDASAHFASVPVRSL